MLQLGFKYEWLVLQWLFCAILCLWAVRSLVGFKYAGRMFRVGVVEEKHIDWLAEAANKVGDIRICFNVLRTAGLLAECEGKTKLEREHFLNAAKTIQHTVWQSRALSM